MKTFVTPKCEQWPVFVCPRALGWTKNDQPIGQESPKHRVLFSEGLHQFASDLIIYKVDHTDFANYGCFSSNEVGSDYKVLPL